MSVSCHDWRFVEAGLAVSQSTNGGTMFPVLAFQTGKDQMIGSTARSNVERVGGDISR